MPMEVYSAAKPGKPWRAWVATALLLAGVCSLAQGLVARRGTGLLSEPVQPAGWDIRYRYPRVLQPATDPPVTDAEEEAFSYVLSKDGAEARITLHRFQMATGITPAQICLYVISRYTSSAAGPGFMAVRPTARREFLGNVEAFEVEEASAGVIVRAAAIGSNRIYGVSLRANPAAMDVELIQYFELVCRSIEVVTP